MLPALRLRTQKSITVRFCSPLHSPPVKQGAAAKKGRVVAAEQSHLKCFTGLGVQLVNEINSPVWQLLLWRCYLFLFLFLLFLPFWKQYKLFQPIRIPHSYLIPWWELFYHFKSEISKYFFVKDYIINIFGSAGHMVSVSAAPLCSCITKAVMDNV